MKKYLLAVIVTFVLAIPSGCTRNEVHRGSAPLQTDGVTAPPPGCIDLRKRGGAC